MPVKTYFYLTQKGVMEDDKRNHINFEKKKVVLYHEHSRRIENGIYFARMMNMIRKTLVLASLFLSL